MVTINLCHDIVLNLSTPVLPIFRTSNSRLPVKGRVESPSTWKGASLGRRNLPPEWWEQSSPLIEVRLGRPVYLDVSCFLIMSRCLYAGIHLHGVDTAILSVGFSRAEKSPLPTLMHGRLTDAFHSYHPENSRIASSLFTSLLAVPSPASRRQVLSNCLSFEGDFIR